jgi:hypothetical protein
MRWLPAAALLLVLATFLPTLRFGFVNWDDDIHVTRNPAVVGGDVPARLRWLTPNLGYPIPVTVASYRIEHALFGLRPGVYHATNVLLHLTSCLLVYALGRWLGLGAAGATAALLLFGLHPVVSEPVSWISGRKDLLATTLGLAATLALCRSLDAPRARRWGALAATLFAAAALAKPSVLLLPLFWLLLSRGAGRPGWRAVLPAVVPAALVAMAVAAVAFIGQRNVGAVSGPLGVGVWLRQVWYAFGYHLGLALFVQAPLAKHIPAALPPPFQVTVDLLPVLVLAAVIAVAARLTPERRRIGALGLAWAALAYLPSANLVPLARFVADTYVYWPLAGLAWAAGAALEGSLHTVRAAAAGVAAAVTLAALTLNASGRWRSGVELWESVQAVHPDVPQICRDLGNAYNEAGRFPAALARYQQCARRFGPALFEKNIGITLVLLGRRDEASALFRRLAAEHPEDPVVRRYHRELTGPP